MEYEGLAAVIASHIKEKGEKTVNAALSSAAKLASQISLLNATHVLKYHHSLAAGSNVNARNSVSANDTCYLDTSTLRNITFDTAVDNAASLGAASLLLCEHNGTSLATALKRGDYSALVVFAHSEEQLQEWVSGFKKALSDKPITSHTLAKQLYFPVGKQDYHLLSPLFSSSLSQAIYQRIADGRFGEEAKAVREARKAGKYAAKPEVNYPNTAVQNFGGSKPQNISQLNSGRGGRSYLLSCASPSWRSEPKPPMSSKSIFSGEYSRRAWRQTHALQQYLLSISERDSTSAIRDQVQAYMNELIDTLFQYATEVQGMTQHIGWSATSKLKREQQLWLDPYRNDSQFQSERARGDWQLRIADDFAFWLKRRLKHEHLVFGETEHQEWLRVLNRRLSLFNKTLQEFETDLPEVAL